MNKKSAFIYLFVSIFISIFAMTSFAANFTDMPNDWSNVALENAVKNGLIKGDGGKIMPSENLTRAQMATIVNRAFGTTDKASLDSYTDLESEAWYYNEMAKAVQMKTFVGSGGKLNPNDNINREEAFVVLARAFKLGGGSESAIDKFSDKNSVSSWAKDGIASLVSSGYIAGADGKLNPTKNITRAEFSQIMNNLLQNYINVANTYTKELKGNVMINVPGVILKNITISGDLIIGDGVGNGDVTLDGVTVTGRTVVRGGGVNSIKIIGKSNVKNIIIARVDGKVRVYTEGGTEIGEVTADGSDDIILEGTFGSVTIVAPDVTVTATNAKITDATLEGKNSEIILGANSEIKTLTLETDNVIITAPLGSKIDNIIINGDGTNISGIGKVGTVTANADNITVTVIGAVVKATIGSTGILAGKIEVLPGSTKTVATQRSTSGRSSNNQTYTVNYNVDGGVAISELTGVTALADPLPTPTKAGYTFAGWYTEDTLTNMAVAGATITANTTLYAKWTINNYTITYDSQGGSAVNGTTGDYNITITAPTAPTKTGYTFGGWYKEAGCITAWAFATDVITANTTLYAKWTAINYSVTFDSQGGSAVSGTTADYNTKVTAPSAPIKTGYTFGGWYKEAGFITEWTFATDVITGNTTLYAKWTINSYAVTFDSQGGSAVTATNTNYNTTITAPTAPTKTGYTFGGWYKEAGCITAWAFATDVITANTTLYAKWTAINYSVTFDSQGGSAVTGTTGDYNTKVTAPSAPTKTGYTFSGWYKEAGCTTAWAFATDVITGNTTLYAKWTINNYTVTYDSQGGSAVSGANANYNTIITAPTAPTKTGYTFGGWYKEAGCITAWAFATDVITANTTLYAKWTAINYSITFDSQGGSAVSGTTGDYNTKVTAPSAPTKTGYTFGGWYKEAGCTTAWTFVTDVITGNTTLYAKWTIDNYTVTFDSQGGSAVTATNTNYNTTITAPTAPTKTGYTFGGWYKEAGCITAWAFATDVITANTTLYAKWNLITYTISYETNGGSTVDSTNGATLPSPLPTTTKTDLDFDGWYTSADFATVAKAGDPITANITLYAKWKTIIYIISGDGTTTTYNLELVTETLVAEAPAIDLTAINSANDKPTMAAALKALEVELSIDMTTGTYGSMDVSRQPSVSQYVIDSKPTSGYTTALQVKTAFEAGLAYESAKWTFSTALYTNSLTLENFNSIKNAYVAHKAYRLSVGKLDDTATAILAIDKAISNFTEIKTAIEAVFNDNTALAGAFTNAYRINDVFGYINSFVLAVPTYSVTYNTNGGSTVPELTGVTALADPLPTPTKAGYTFAGWYTEDSLTNLAVPGATITANTTLFAKWTAIVITYTVTYNTDGGSDVPELTGVTVLADPLPTPTKAGYTFAGWYTEDTLTNLAVAGTTITANTTLFAKWTAIVITYSVTYNTNGGSDVPEITGVTELADPLPTPTKAGYTFAGWYTEDTLTNLAVAGATITANTTLFAKWTLNSAIDTVLVSEDGTTTTYNLELVTDTLVENSPS